jgi:RNA recognition motif-containing protein
MPMYTNAFLSENAAALIAGTGIATFVAGLLTGLAVRSGSRKTASGEEQTKEGLIELYVGNLPYDTTENQLRKLVEDYGEVASARIIKNSSNGKSKGFGFVEIVGQAEADAAVSALHGTDYKGRKIVVNEAKSRSKSRSRRR